MKSSGNDQFPVNGDEKSVTKKDLISEFKQIEAWSRSKAEKTVYGKLGIEYKNIANRYTRLKKEGKTSETELHSFQEKL